ncbi:GerAB/ArcD/ProY family transporter [Clostridium sp. DL1XJH146]
MKNKEYISPLQFYFIVVGFTLGTAIILSSGIDTAGRDIWICHLIAMITSIISLLMIFSIVCKFPEKDSFEILEHIFGKGISKIILLIFFLVSVALTALVLDNIGEMMILMVIQNTEEWVYIMSIILLSAFLLRKGIEISARCIQIMAAFCMIVSIIVLSFISVNIDFNTLLPIFSKDFDIIYKTTIIVSSFPYLEVVIMFFLVPTIKKNERKKALKLGILGIVATSFYFIITDIFIIGIFGEKEAGRILFPTYEVVRMVSLGEFVTRIEIVILLIWFVTTYSKITICLYSIMKSVQGIFNLKDYKRLAIPIGVFLVPIGTNAYKNYEEINILTLKTWPIIMIFIFFLLFVIFIGAKIKKNE